MKHSYLFKPNLIGLDGKLHGYLTFRGAKKIGDSEIGMDTKYNRNGLHMWIGYHKKLTKKKDIEAHGGARTVFISESIHLTRDDAWLLIKEIEDRIF